VFASIAAAGQEPHWAYGKGMSRLSCCFCILASRQDLATAAALKPALFQRYLATERKIDRTFVMPKGGRRLFLDEIVAQVLKLRDDHTLGDRDVPAHRVALGIEAEPRDTLFLGRDPEIGDKAGHTWRGEDPHELSHLVHDLVCTRCTRCTQVQRRQPILEILPTPGRRVSARRPRHCRGLGAALRA
jgi:hypothetical protein